MTPQDTLSDGSTDYQKASESVRRRRYHRKESGAEDREDGQLDLETAASTKRLDEWGESDE